MPVARTAAELYTSTCGLRSASKSPRLFRDLPHRSSTQRRWRLGIHGRQLLPHTRILVGRLAIDTSLRGQGYGEQLLLDALGKAVAASEIGGGRLIVVDAIDDEAPAFSAFHFVPVRTRERRLVMKMSTAAKALGERRRE